VLRLASNSYRIMPQNLQTLARGACVCLFIGFTALSFAQEPLKPRMNEAFNAAAEILDARWDSKAALLGSNKSHTVRGSAWYGLGLITRDKPGDFENGIKTLIAVAHTQIDLPQLPWDGTFKRVAEEKLPPLNGKAYVDYDPNWREFVGTIFALALIQHGDRISAQDTLVLENAIKHAINGEIKQKRLPPTYTNIALMYAFLWTFAGQRFHNDQYIKDGEAWAEKIYQSFEVNHSFDEFNSPTYCGVDLYALALLRRYGATTRLREIGASMEADQWRDIARFYHAGLRNLAGPFDRSYGMDMTRYASLVGVWLSFYLPNDKMPFPVFGGSMDHGGDFFCALPYAAVGTRIPQDILKEFSTFSGERLVERKIANGTRTATAWLGENLMIGAEYTGLTRGILTRTSQFHPVTIHWKHTDGSINWIKITKISLCDCIASKNGVSITTDTGDVVFRVHAPGSDIKNITQTRWVLQNLALDVTSDAKKAKVRIEDNDIMITYQDVKHMAIHSEYISN